MKKATQLVLLAIIFLFASESKAQQLPHKADTSYSERQPEHKQSLSKSSQLLDDTQNLLKRSYQSYNDGNPQEAESILKQILEIFGASGRQPNFELPDPGGVRRNRFNIPGIINIERTRTVSSEVTTLDTSAALPLAQLFDHAVYRISNNPSGFQLSDFQDSIWNRFGGCLRFGASAGHACRTLPSSTGRFSSSIREIFPNLSPSEIQEIFPGLSSSEITQEALDYTSRQATNNNIHSILKSALELIQISLIDQGTQEKYEEALLFSEVSRSSEFTRIAPIILYGLLNYEALSDNSSYSDRFNTVPEYDLSMKTVKKAARRQDATIVYYSTAAVESENTLFVWVIQPSGEIAFRAVDVSHLGQSLSALTRETLTASASFIDRGQQGRSLIQAVRDLRSQGFNNNEIDLAERYLVEESVQATKLRLLHDVLIDPVSDLLPTDPSSHVIFVPHRELTLAPFAALQDSVGRHLIEKHTISVAHSLISLSKKVDSIKKMPTGSDFVAVGNSDIPDIRYVADNSRVSLPSLPAADAEVVDISPDDGYWFRRSAATQRNINPHLEDAKIIHFATHGLLNFQNKRELLLLQHLESDENQTFYLLQEPDNIQWNSTSDFRYKLWYEQIKDSQSWQAIYAKINLPGAIVLADSPLVTQNILSLDLEADLVVLSACNTGRGVPTESAILGLPLAFGLAGVPRVVVSQWGVPDASTRFLMIKFYEAMERNIEENGKANPAGALREAMLETKNIEGYSDPIFWAGFSMMNVSY